METKNEAATQEVAHTEKPKTIEQVLKEKAEKEKKQSIARNKELEEKRKLEEKEAQEKQEKEIRQKRELQQARMKQVFEKHLKKFEPLEIGEADPRHKLKIENLYDDLCIEATKVRYRLADFLGIDNSELPVEKVFDCIKNDPNDWLPKEYISAKKIEVPENLNIDQVIKLKLVDIPSIESLTEYRQDFLSIYNRIKQEGFIYPLKKLFNEDEKQFTLKIDFFAAVDEFLAEKSTTPEQNVIITIMNNLLESLYDLSDLRIIKLEKGPAELQQLNNFLTFKGGGANINPRIFKRHPALKQYFEPPQRNSQRATLDELLQ